MCSQSYAFSGVLENELPTAVNVEDAGLLSFNALAVQKLVTYFGSYTFVLNNICACFFHK